MTVPVWTEMQLAVGGALRLARGDRSGLGFFDTSLDGFWRSFRAALVCYPLSMVLLALRLPAVRWGEAGAATILAVETIAFVISWVAFPLVVLPIARFFDRENRFLPFMVVYNWSQIPQTGLFAIVGLDAATGVLPPAAAQLAGLGAVAAVLVYEWYIARVALAVTAAQAALVVVVDVVLGSVLDQIAKSLY
jgi:hypothetical protein